MIPLTYRLRDGVRIEDAPSGPVVVSELPLAVVRVNRAAAALLELTRGGCAVPELADTLAVDEQRVVLLCERLRARGLLEVEPAQIPADIEPPSVSVVIPTKDRASELDACLASLATLDYPADRIEVIVVDDGSTDDTPAVAAAHPCTYVVNQRNRGQSYSRNRGAREASGEILAFLDSDCVASPAWLRELTPFFAWGRVAGVGGLVSGYYDSTRLDRFEQVASSLNLGRRLLLMTDDDSMGYIPTCSLLVRRDAYVAVDGLREDLRVGEDVDLCWRLRAAGHWLVYTPTGEVWHRHRDRFTEMLRQRAVYGTSEPLLLSLHPDKRKTVTVRPLPALTVLGMAAALLSRRPVILVLCAGFVALDSVRSRVRLSAEGVRVDARRLWFSTVRAHLSLAYSASFHLARYYVVPAAAAGVVVPGLWALTAAATVYVTALDYRVKRPRLGYPAFLAFSVAEHTAYQVGVAVGCLRVRSLRVHRLRVRIGGRRGTRSGGVPEDRYASPA
jgi:mycofactocin system glycosyltransferase